MLQLIAFVGGSMLLAVAGLWLEQRIVPIEILRANNDVGGNYLQTLGTIYAVARYQPDPNGFLTRMGGVLSRKRTALYRVEPDRLVRLSDLPSSSDTSYAGVVVQGGALYVDYYTSRIDRDWPWLFGMFMRSDIRMARIPLDALTALSKATP